MSLITTHVLDLASGRPAPGLRVDLERQDGSGRWAELGRGATDADGRIRDLLSPGAAVEPGTYRLRFHTGAYFGATGTTTFYPYVEVAVTITDPGKHHHVPLLLSPFGYSTCRGS
jgi:5-hydroxyisourate hydrolase